MGSRKDVTIIIVDIGKNVAEPENKNEKSFFENARDCIMRIVERKIMSRPNDLIGLILLGSNTTKNNLAEQVKGAFTNIHFLFECQTPSWQMLRDLPEKPTQREGDWFEALLVASDYLKNGLYGFNVISKKIVLMTNFQNPAYIGNNIEKVIKGFQDENFEVTVIGHNIYDEALKGEDIHYARCFVEVTNGDVATFEDAMRYLMFHRKKVTRVGTWNVDLNIGPNIKIPVSVYSRIRSDTVIKSWQKAVRDPVTTKSSTEEAVIKKKEFTNTEHQIVEVEETIKGYLYGQKAIPFSENDKSLLYKSGEKCLSIYGFTNAKNVKWQNLSGNGVSYLFGRKGDKKADRAIKCLIQCLLDNNLVGIARRVYNNGNAPMMHVLSPLIDNQNFICLSVIGLTYKEDIKNMAFPPTDIQKYACTKEQVDAFRDLIKSMDLMSAYDISYDDREAFPTAETVNPSVQHILDCMTFRAMNPGKPLPPPRDDIMMLFKVPAPVEKRSRDAIEKLTKMFDLKKVETKPQKNKIIGNLSQDLNHQQHIQNDVHTSEVPKIELLNSKEEVLNIGTINPIEDFKTLHNNGISLDELSVEMTDILETLFYLNFDDDYSKALETMKFFRDECVRDGPLHYNNWCTQFKKNLLERKRDDLIQLLVENNLNFITTDENATSTFTAGDTNDDSQVYDNDTVPDATELAIESEINDFFDEM